jgi:hypothetical protein
MDTAQLRAGEMESASNLLGGQLGGVRGQDVDVAKTAAQLRQEAALSNQRVGSTTSLANAASRNQRDEFRAGQDMAAQGANAAAGNARTMDEAQLRAGVDTGNVTRGQQNEQFNAGAQTTAAAANAAAGNQRQEQQAGRTDEASARNQAAINRTPEFNATQTQDAAKTNQNAGLQGAQLDVTRRQGLAGDALGAMQQGTSIQTSRIGKAASGPSTADRIIGGVTTLGAAGLTALVPAAAPLTAPVAAGGIKKATEGSDERLKKNVSDVPGDAAERLARALQTKEFEYKDGNDYDDGRTHFGVMAQDLERDPLGRKLVGQDDDGNKTVDYQGLTQLLLAAALRGKKEARR